MSKSKKLIVNKQYAFCSTNFFYFCNFIKQQKEIDFKVNIDLILNLLTKLKGRDIVTYSDRGKGYTTASIFYICYLSFFSKKDSSFLIIHGSNLAPLVKTMVKTNIENLNKLFSFDPIVTIKDVSNVVLNNSYYDTVVKIVIKSNPDINLLKQQDKPFEYILLDPITTDMSKWSTLHPYFINQSEKELIFNCSPGLLSEVIVDSVYNKTHNFINF